MGGRVAIERSAGAMRSPVNWALLGLVIQRPSYGYELIQRFERTYGDALELSSPSQIYTALDTLVKRGLIEELPGEEGHGVVRQPKPHYRATKEGVAGYREWLISQTETDRRRSRLFGHQLAMLSPEDALSVLDRYETACLQEACAPPPGNGAGGETGHSDMSVALAERLAREDERLAVGARLEWIEYARRQLGMRPRTNEGGQPKGRLGANPKRHQDSETKGRQPRR